MCKHGVPNRIIHDRAAEFMSEVLQETARLFGLTHLPTSGSHPQTDGLVERLNRTLKQMLSKIVTRGGKDWDELLGPVLFAYRTVPHSSTGETPFSLLYGRDPRVPTSMNFYQPAKSLPVEESHYAKELFKELKHARQLAQKCIVKAQHSQKCHYDKRSKNSTIKSADLVMMKVEPKFRLDRSYHGPYRVLDVTPTNAIIQKVNDPNSENLNVSLQRLSKCDEHLSEELPWMGHSTTRRRQIKRKFKFN